MTLLANSFEKYQLSRLFVVKSKAVRHDCVSFWEGFLSLLREVERFSKPFINNYYLQVNSSGR